MKTRKHDYFAPTNAPCRIAADGTIEFLVTPKNAAPAVDPNRVILVAKAKKHDIYKTLAWRYLARQRQYVGEPLSLKECMLSKCKPLHAMTFRNYDISRIALRAPVNETYTYAVDYGTGFQTCYVKDQRPSTKNYYMDEIWGYSEDALLGYARVYSCPLCGSLGGCEHLGEVIDFVSPFQIVLLEYIIIQWCTLQSTIIAACCPSNNYRHVHVKLYITTLI